MAIASKQAGWHVLRHLRVSTEELIVGAIVLLALGVRLTLVPMEHVLQGDEGAYLWLGKTLVTGGGFQFFGRPELHYTPLFPIVSGAIGLLARDLVIASKVCFVLFGALTILPVYLIARKLHSRTAGYVAAGLVAVAPALTSYVYFWGSMTEPLYFCLVFAGVYVSLFALEDGRWSALAGAGALFGLAYLTRPEGWLFVALLAGYLGLLGWIRYRRSRWKGLLQAAIVVGAFLVLTLPYLIYLRSHLGYWTLTGKTWMAFIQQRAYMDRDWQTFDRMSWGLDSTGLEVMYHSMDKFTQHNLLQEIAADPRAFAGHVFRNARQLNGALMSKRVLPFFLIPFIGLGLFRRAWRPARLVNEVYLALAAIAPAAAFAVYTTDLRFYLGAIILIFIWVGEGVAEWGRWLEETLAGLQRQAEVSPEHTSRRNAELIRGRAARWSVVLIATALATYFLAIQPVVIRDGHQNLRTHYKIVGEWLKVNSPPDAVVMSRGATVAIHADRFWAPFPHASYSEVLTYARAHGVDYLVINEQEFRLMRPQLEFLAGWDAAPAELEPILVHDGPTGKTVVYRLRQS